MQSELIQSSICAKNIWDEIHKSPFKHFGARNPFCDLQHIVIAKKNGEELQGLHFMHFKIEQICKGKSVTVSAHWGCCLVSALFHPSL